VRITLFNAAGEEILAQPERLHFFNAITGVNALQPSFVPDLGGSGVVFLQGPDQAWTWDGKGSQGQWMGSGVYLVQFEMTDSFGLKSTYTQALTVLRSPSQTGVDVFNSAGERVRHWEVPGSPVRYLRLNSTQFVPDGVGSGLKISWDDDPAAALVWDGLNDAGARVTSGVYQVRVTREEAGSASSVLKTSVVVLNAPGPLLQDAAAGPSPLPAGTRVLHVAAPSLGPADRLTGRLYSLDGGLVATGAALGPAMDLSLPSLAGGVYLVELDAQSQDGRRDRRTLKLAVVR
jgi:hypothetical protein